jgi:hypothetical protein
MQEPTDVYKKFMLQPLSAKILVANQVPGVGPATVDALKLVKITSAQQLMGCYLLHNRDDGSFADFLETHLKLKHVTLYVRDGTGAAPRCVRASSIARSHPLVSARTHMHIDSRTWVDTITEGLRDKSAPFFTKDDQPAPEPGHVDAPPLLLSTQTLGVRSPYRFTLGRDGLSKLTTGMKVYLDKRTPKIKKHARTPTPAQLLGLYLIEDTPETGFRLFLSNTCKISNGYNILVDRIRDIAKKICELKLERPPVPEVGATPLTPARQLYMGYIA